MPSESRSDSPEPLFPGWYPTRVMLHLTDISKSFGTQAVLDEASLHVKPGMRIGLIGANGAGKTTLLRIIVGEMSLDGGEISARKDLRIGFLPAGDRGDRRPRRHRGGAGVAPGDPRCREAHRRVG